MTPFIKKIILVLFLFCCTFSFAQTKSPKPKTKTKDSITNTIFVNADKTFGYSIFLKGKKLIHQPNIPAVPGNAGFKTKAEALKVATLMQTKIKKNIMPPTVDIKELDSLKINYK